jgi:hypothetical protein
VDKDGMGGRRLARSFSRSAATERLVNAIFIVIISELFELSPYNEARPHQGRWCFGKTPMQTFLAAMPMTKEKMIAAYQHRTPKPDRSTRHRLSDRVAANTVDPTGVRGALPTAHHVPDSRFTAPYLHHHCRAA